MTERLADVSARIEGVRQLGAVVNAMKGIAAARARTARAQVDAVDSYAATISTAMARILVPHEAGHPAPRSRATGGGRTGLLLFLAEQGFAGAFSERVLDSVGNELETADLLLVGTRGLSIAAARGLEADWSAAMPSHSPGIPKLADGITRAIYHALDEDRFDRLDVVHASWSSGRPQIARRTLFPVDLSDARPATGEPPITQLPPETLLASLGADYVHALVCKAALHAFAAENEARMKAMAAAGTQIASELEVFEATLRRVRQEAITAEIIELGTGAASANVER
ncbi:F0F1 ATP synthase subunit gamma [Stappia sp. ICDLI1TA098]|jgi:F-type H+-transporting ATPase subunit gamma